MTIALTVDQTRREKLATPTGVWQTLRDEFVALIDDLRDHLSKLEVSDIDGELDRRLPPMLRDAIIQTKKSGPVAGRMTGRERP
jgi:hypothetical protein